MLLRRITLGLLLATLALPVAGAQGLNQALTLDQAVERAVAVNTDYQGTLLAVDKARSVLSAGVNWKSIAISATQKQTSATATTEASSATSLGLSLPLFDQLGASASVDQDGNSQVSVTATPLVHSDTAVQARITYDKALLAAAQARTSLETAVRKAALAQMTAQAQWEVQRQVSLLKETSYRDAKTRYEKAQVTLAEVRTALQDWTSARSTQTTLEKALVKAQADLAGKLQAQTVELVPLDAQALESAVLALGSLDAEVTGISTAVKAQALEVEAQQAKVEALWVFDPSLSISGSASLPAAGEATWSGSVTLTVALGDWQAADRSLAARAATQAQLSLEAQRVAVRSAQAQASLTLKAARATAENRLLALDQARELFTETQLLFRAGESTALELEDAQLGVTSAEIDLFSAWADVYGAALDWGAARS